MHYVVVRVIVMWNVIISKKILNKITEYEHTVKSDKRNQVVIVLQTA